MEAGEDTETKRPMKETEDTHLEKQANRGDECHFPPIDGLSSALLTWKCQAMSLTHTGAFKLTTNEVPSSIQRLWLTAEKHYFHIGLASTNRTCTMERRSGQVTLTNDRSK